MQLHIDLQQVRITDGITYVWKRWDEREVKRSADGTTSRSSVILEALNCESRQRAVAAIRYYAGPSVTGAVVRSLDTPAPKLIFDAAAPASFAEAIINAACSDQSFNRAKSATGPSVPDIGAIVYSMASKSVAVIKTDARTQGSAVALIPIPGDGTVFATNCHVLAGARELTVESAGTRAQGFFFGGDPSYDTCLVFAKIQTEVPERFNTLDLLVGERVFAIGAPRGLELSMTEGIVSAKRGSPLEPPMLLQTTAPISPGSSGGGLFDSKGRLVGITTFYIKDSQNLNFAVAINMFNGLLERSTVKSLEELSQFLKKREASKN